LTDVELCQQEAALFSSSQTLYDLLLRAGATEDTSALQAQLVSAGVSATRLNAYKKEVAEAKAALLPHEAIAAAGNRADIVVLPNLKDYQATRNQAESMCLTMTATANSCRSKDKNKYTMKSSSSMVGGDTKPLLGMTTGGGSSRTPYFETKPSKSGITAEGRLLPDIMNNLLGAAGSTGAPGGGGGGYKSSGTIPSNSLNYKKGWNETTASIVLS